jgi:hypothetical protein
LNFKLTVNRQPSTVNRQPPTANRQPPTDRQPSAIRVPIRETFPPFGKEIEHLMAIYKYPESLLLTSNENHEKNPCPCVAFDPVVFMQSFCYAL